MPPMWQTRLLVFKGLHEKSQVRLIAKRMSMSRNEVVGALLEVWFKFQDLASAEGKLVGKSAAWLDLAAGRDGFAESMAAAGWLTVEPDGLTVANFDEFISRSAVRRQENTIRKAQARSGRDGGDEGNRDNLGTTSGQPRDKVPDVPPPPDAPPAKPKRAKAVPCPLFDRFWEAYPKSHQQARPRASAEWKKLKVTIELFDTIMAGLKRWVDSPNWKEDHGRWIPFPTNFLKGQRWNDAPGGSGGAGGGRTVHPLGRVSAPPGKYANLKRHIVAGEDPQSPPDPAPDRRQPATLFPLEGEEPVAD